ncbi:right-handed parallel beta-helix repeat-containing protein [Aureibaculum sp. A20]|uniref:Right-handed parallel beta-helix repeat-containing protein n=1 Tax=Aureibaculum flavum TaxID=2795986 RepID=A0ABS0WVC2_9FLAO|nr:right-handed parallel beta-helix repeat-containing protein [Aureibaculum flavum]MBJ2175933.1 right-handed parallel beta-helix repeat-containing protein [Aureibaculum flavum]
MKKSIFTLLSFLLFSLLLQAKEYHVSKKGNDFNEGSKVAPFKTISKAAKVAQPGDVITVHEGIYREWVNPRFGGINDSNRIVYQAAENEEVWIKGSEHIKTWKKHKGTVWKVVLNNDFFGDFNPYQEIVYGDWLTKTYGRDHHLGEVYINGKALYEIDSLAKVFSETSLKRATDTEGSKYKWYCESNQETTTIYANLNGINPNKELVEINVRPTVFFPKNTGINYITVRGFKMAQAATQWAPPTAEQEGLIGPNWSKGWIIEDNVISDSKCSGIVIGKERASGQNLWKRDQKKHGTQREREVVFKALQLGWSKETIGSHIIRNNTIRDCEQGGIIGHLGGVFSEISNNHIYNINVKKQFDGWEIGGIKLHAAIDVIIKNNFIHDNHRGIWLDWQAQGARVTGNLLFNNEDQDLFIEVNHGPMIIDNNILLSENGILNASQGTAFINNLIAGNVQMRAASNRFTHYHFPHSTEVLGMMTVILGDDRYYNNIFAANNDTLNKSQFYGLNAYNDFPSATYQWKSPGGLNNYNKQKFPVFIDGNLYVNKALPSTIETNFLENRTLNPAISLTKEGDGYYLNMTVDESFKRVKTQLVTTALLGAAFQSETPFENRDGSPITINQDFFGKIRTKEIPIVGPFENLKIGKNKIKVWNIE